MKKISQLVKKTQRQRPGKRIRKKQAFTLIELIVVLAVLGVILAIAVPNYSQIQDQADDKAERATAALIIKSARLMQVNEGFADARATLLSMVGYAGAEERLDVAVHGVQFDDGEDPSTGTQYMDPIGAPKSFPLDTTEDGQKFTVELGDGTDFTEGDPVN